MDIFMDSYLRANLIAWLPIKKTDKVCYIGKPTDVIAKKLQELSDFTECVAGVCELAAYTKYDYLIRLGKAKQEELDAYAACLSVSGKLIFAVENAYGMKYLAGAKDTGAGEYFGAVEALPSAAGMTLLELKTRLAKAGFRWQTAYYPFPDYYFAMSVYSDEYLPKQGELIDQIGNFDAERLVLFEEGKAFDAAVARGKFADFANSYLMAAGKDASGRLANEEGESVCYVKFSNDRGKRHNIRTLVTKSEDGKLHLLKLADNSKAAPQIERIKKTSRTLRALYRGTDFLVNGYTERKNGIELEFLRGHTLEEELDALLEQGQKKAAFDKMLEAFAAIRSIRDLKEFEMTDAFVEVFGQQELPAGLLSAPVSDIDLIMPNIFIGEDGSKTIIDYEWSFHFPVPLNFTIYRGIHYYADTTAMRRTLDPEALYEKAGICRQELTAYAAMEEAFQAYVLLGHTPMRQLYRECGKPAYHISSVLHVVDELERRRALQIYFDRGNGFCEADTVTYHSKALDGTYHLQIPIGEDVAKLRIDPGSQACTVEIERLSLGGKSGINLEFISNGHKMAGTMYLFDTDDPNILLTKLPAGPKTLFLDMRIESMSLAAAEWIAPKIDAKYKLKKILKK